MAQPLARTSVRNSSDEEKHVFLDLTDLHGRRADGCHPKAIKAARRWTRKPFAIIHFERAVVARADIHGLGDGMPDLIRNLRGQSGWIGDEVDITTLVGTFHTDRFEATRCVVTGGGSNHHAADPDRTGSAWPRSPA